MGLRRSRPFPLIGLACALLLTACSQSPAQPAAPSAPKAAASLRFVDTTIADAQTLQPLIANDDASSSYYGLLYDGLLQIDPKTLEKKGKMAKSYKVSDDRKAITFTLRDDLKWSDGQPITSADWKFTWSRLTDPKTKFCCMALLTLFDRIETPDPKTIVFHWKEPFAPALDYCDIVPPLPEHVFKNLDINDNPANNKPEVVSGMWQLKEWVKDDHATFVRNEAYWDEKPTLDTYIYRVVKDSNAAYAALKNKEVDSSAIQPQDWDEATRNPNLQAYHYYTLGTGWGYVAFNLRDPRFQDVRVRHALAHAVDKQKIVDRVLLGHAKPINSAYPPSSPVYTDDVPKFEFSPDKARDLLKQAGWQPGPDGVLARDGKPFKVRLHFNAGNKVREQIATVIQQQLKDVGVAVNVQQEDFGALLKRVRETHDFDLVLLGWVGGYEPHSGASIWAKGSDQNYGNYSNPRVEQLFAQGVKVFDMKDRRPIYAEIQRILAEDTPYIFLYASESLHGFSKRVGGLDPGPLGYQWNMEKWTITDKP